GTCKRENLDLVRDEITRELNRLVDDGMTSAELKRVRRQVLNAHLYSLETNSGRASTIGYSHVYFGSAAMLTDYADEIRGVSESDIRKFAKQWLDASRSSFHVTSGPAENIG